MLLNTESGMLSKTNSQCYVSHLFCIRLLFFISDKVYKVYFSVGTSPRIFFGGGEGKVTKIVLFYIILCSPS